MYKWNNMVTVVILLLTFTIINAQNSGIKGYIKDNLNGYKLEKSTITLMDPKDSLLIAYTRSAADGSFTFTNMKAGRYDVFFSYPDYLGYATEIVVEEGVMVNLDTILLFKNDQFLKEITIVDASKIRFKGDTIEFKVDSFKIGQNATVEDLLRKLSGLQVNAKGEITAFGEKVQKVYVDGEEFFGSDPTIATQNIQAKAVDKVQVFDKTSKMEELTGIADDEKFKAINLQLKDEYKQGYFGMAKAGIGGSPLYYDESLMFQGYQGKSKLSLYGITSNTGTTGLDFDERDRYLGSSSSISFDDGVMFFTSDDEFSWDGRYDGQGKPRSIAGGASFSTKLAKDKVKINANYGYADQSLDKNSTQNATNYLQSDSYTSYEKEFQQNNKNTHSGKINIESDIDSLTNITFKASASKSNIDNIKSIHSTRNAMDSTAITAIDRNLNNQATQNAFKSELSLLRKFSKKKRLFTLIGKFSLSDKNGNTGLKSNNDYYALNRFEVIDQLQNIFGNNDNYNILTSFTEPLSEKTSVQGNYYYSNSKNKLTKLTNEYDELTHGYTRYIDTLSNHFDYTVSTHGGGLLFAYTEEIFNFKLGANVDNSNSIRKNLIENTVIDNHAVRWLPNAQAMYKFNRNTRLNFTYRGSTKQPTLEQIQPVRDNSNPLELIKGNPDLIQSYTQDFRLNFNMWKALQDYSIYSWADFSNTYNDIVVNTTIDESKRSISTYENVNGQYSGYMYAGSFFHITKILGGSAGLSYSLNRNISFVNGERVKVLNNSINPNFGISIEIEEKLDADIDYDISFNNSKGGNVGAAGKYLSHNIRSSLSYKVMKNIELKSDIKWEYQGAQSAFADKFSQTIWNAYAEWTVGKNKEFVLQLAVKDILDQNKGYRRYVGTFNTNESTYDTLRRYGMLTLIYNIKNKV